MNSIREESLEEVNPLNYFKVIWKWKILIIVISIITVLYTTINTIYQIDIYQATAVISPIGEEKGSSGLSILSQQFGGIPGISLPPSSSASEIINLMRSNMLREKMINKYNILPVLFPENWDQEKKAWLNNKDIPTMWDGLRTLDTLIAISNNAKENTISISAEFHDPETTVRLINNLLATLTEHMSNEAEKAANTKRKYLEEQLRATSDPLIRQKIYNLISQQVETAMMSEMKEDFAFKVLDPPRVPDRKIKPERRKKIMLSVLFSPFIGIFLSFFLEYINKLRGKGV